MLGLDGMELMRRAREIDPALPVIMITAFAPAPRGSTPSYSRAMGAMSRPPPRRPASIPRRTTASSTSTIRSRRAAGVAPPQ